MTGIFRYIRHHEVAERMNQGWRWIGVADPAWSDLMWWCCGDCEDGEAP